MKMFALVLLAALVVAGCVGQTSPTGAAIEPEKTTTEKTEETAPSSSPEQSGVAVGACKEVYSPQTGEMSLECGMN